MRPLALSLSLALCVVVAALSLTAGFALGGQWIVAGFAALVGLLWLALSLTGQWVNAPKLGWLYTAAAAAGVLVLLPTGLMLLCAVAALCAHDLGEFARRLSAAQRVEQAAALVRRHLLRLLPVALAGVALGVTVLSVHVSLAFGLAVLLAAAAVGLLALAAHRAAAS